MDAYSIWVVCILWSLPDVLKVAPRDNEWHDIYHNFPAFKAPACIVRPMETWLSAESTWNPCTAKQLTTYIFSRFIAFHLLFVIVSEMIEFLSIK